MTYATSPTWATGLVLLSIVTAAVAPMRPALADEPAAGSLAEVIVTAQRREQSSQDVGISLTALGGDQLTELGIRNSMDLAGQIPALLFNNALGGTALAIPSIRGVSQNDFTIHQEGPVAAYVDDVYLSFGSAASFALFDTNRIEVLRGPQGTLFGRNATGGLIHYVSNRPTSEFEAYSDLTIGRFDQVRFDGAVSGPLSDRVNARLAATAEYHAPSMTNLYGHDSLDEKTIAVRARLDVRITDDIDLLVTLNYGKEFPYYSNRYKHQTVYPNSQGNGVVLPPTMNYYNTCPGCDPNGWRDPPTNAWTGTWDYPARTDRQLYGVTTDLEGTAAGWKWVWINNYMNFRIHYGEDSDATPFPVIAYHENQTASQISEELRFSRSFDRAEVLSGFYFLNIDGNTATPTTLPQFDTTLLPYWNQKTRSYALFSQIDWQLTERWKLVTGARWTYDAKQFDYVFAGNGGPPVTFNTNTVGDLADQRKNLFSGKVQLEWRPMSGALVYGGVSRGVKGGGFNGSLTGATPAAEIPFKPETLVNYEAGFKATGLNGSLQVNGSVFYYNYKNYQGFTFQNLNEFVGNYDAHAHGAELEIHGKAAPGWDYSVGLSQLSFVVENVVMPFGQTADTHPPQAPPFQLDLMLRKTWSVGADRQISVQADAVKVGPYQASLENAPDTAIPGYWLPNARITYKTVIKNWEISAFCRNITNKQILVYAIDTNSLAYDNLYYLPPRWFGVELNKHW